MHVYFVFLFRCGRVDLQQQKADTMVCGALDMFSFYCLPRLGSHCVAITVDDSA